MPSNEKIEGEFHYAEFANKIQLWKIVRIKSDTQPDEIVGFERYHQDAMSRINQLDNAARHFIELGKQQREKPTGTIFELDMFRERLEREADDWQNAGILDVPRRAVAHRLSMLAADLKPLIDNVMAQYCPDGGGDA